MIIFNDNENWLNDRIAHIPKSYYVPETFNGDGICIDIGSNVGAFSIVYNKKFEKIHCYEPSEYAYNECLKNLKNYNNIVVNKYAITNKSNELIKLKSHKGSNFSGNASIIDSSDWNDIDNFEFVESKSFQDVLNECGILNVKNYVKIDTEGSEYVMLMNQDLSMIDYLAIEIHIQLGVKKVNELRNYLLNYFDIIKDSGGGNSHYETVYINKRLNLLTK